MATISVHLALVDKNEVEISGGNYRRIPVEFVDGKMKHPVVFPPATTDWPEAHFLGLCRGESGELVATIPINGGTPITGTTQTIQEIGAHEFTADETRIFEGLFGAAPPPEQEPIELTSTIEAKIKQTLELFEEDK
jgi:hypothetical protein